MQQRADHPHQAAVHLVRSLKCCSDCNNVSEADYAQLNQLQLEKNMLMNELSQMGNAEAELERLSAEVHDLQFLIGKVRQENAIAYETGLRQVETIVRDRQTFERQNSQSMRLQVVAEQQRHRALSIEIQRHMEHIKYLHSINEELVNRFVRY